MHTAGPLTAIAVHNPQSRRAVGGIQRELEEGEGGRGGWGEEGCLNLHAKEGCLNLQAVKLYWGSAVLHSYFCSSMVV